MTINKTKRILITNDDGINAEGILRLAEESKEFGEVWIVAPDGQCSAMSHRITYFNEITVYKADFPISGITAFACSGTPADCVRVGIKLLMQETGSLPDFVFSGINHGYNISADIQYSGTVGAALEGAFWGIQSIAFSENTGTCHDVREAYLSAAMKECMHSTCHLGKNNVWNINFPSCSLDECNGIMRNCNVSTDNFYDDDYKIETSSNGVQTFKVIPKRNWQASAGTDLYAVSNNYVSIGIVNNIC